MNKQSHFLARSQRAKIKASIHYYFSEKWRTVDVAFNLPNAEGNFDEWFLNPLQDKLQQIYTVKISAAVDKMETHCIKYKNI